MNPWGQRERRRHLISPIGNPAGERLEQIWGLATSGDFLPLPNGFVNQTEK